jgi:hydrogenase maturation protein HypF
LIRVALTARGILQGVGFRPFVDRLARSMGLGGHVQNTADAVQIEVEGPPDRIAAFVLAVRIDLPTGALLVDMATERKPTQGTPTFSIRASATSPGARTASPAIPPDIAPCGPCLEEIATPGGRRHAYPFTSCASCGPRFTIVVGTPYDRDRTSMHPYPLCAACASEYDDAADRRYHAQSIACPRCGPALVARDGRGSVVARGRAALDAAAEAFRAGAICAVKGVGGYQLMVDACAESAVAELRRRKQRDAKPFAVLFADLAAVERRCTLVAAEREALCSPAAPIVLVLTRPDADLAPSVAFGSVLTGAMLPASPLHNLLAHEFGGPLVCTSGNVSRQPLCTEDVDAIERLGPIAHRIVSHDRRIVRPADDSVVRVTAFGTTVIRRARGFVPHPFGRTHGGPPIVALGGHLKSTVAVAAGDSIVASQHLGDLDDERTRQLLAVTVDDLTQFLAVRPEIVACDLHPDYASTHLAEDLARRWGARLERVQHHAAHVGAVMAEHRLRGPVLGLAWDGAGYGDDGTLWGGEALSFDGAHCRRIAHLRTFALAGGERATLEPRRAALGLLEAVGEAHRAPAFEERERDLLLRMVARGVQAPRTSSVGRLFDAIAAVAGARVRCDFEGQAAAEFEHAARGDLVATPYPMEIRGDTPPYVIDWEPLLRAVLRDRDRGLAVAEISRSFHAALAGAALAVAERAGMGKVALGGGCFQNARLLAAVKVRLESRGFDVYAATRIPPNDGGLSVGQVHVVGARLHDVSGDTR